MKKLFAILTMLALTCSLIVGCDTTKKKTSASPAAASESAAPAGGTAGSPE